MIIIDYIDYYNLFGGHFHLGVYSRLWAEVYTLMAVCWVIWVDSKFTPLYKLYSHYFTL